MTTREIDVTLSAQFDDGKSPPSSMRICSRLGTMQDPDVPGAGGVIEIMQHVGGFGFELWHADGRKLNVPLAPVLHAACRNLLGVKEVKG